MMMFLAMAGVAAVFGYMGWRVRGLHEAERRRADEHTPTPREERGHLAAPRRDSRGPQFIFGESPPSGWIPPRVGERRETLW